MDWELRGLQVSDGFLNYNLLQFEVFFKIKIQNYWSNLILF